MHIEFCTLAIGYDINGLQICLIEANKTLVIYVFNKLDLINYNLYIVLIKKIIINYTITLSSYMIDLCAR